MAKDENTDKDQEEELIEAEEAQLEDVSSELQEQLEEAETKYKRALADYQNLEKRMADDRREWILQANRDLLLRILPVIDTLMLASKHSEDQSLKVSVQQFLDILQSEGVTKIKTVGKKFDPATMEAVSTAEGKEDEVVEEMRAGFVLHDRLLRPAQVIVGSSKN